MSSHLAFALSLAVSTARFCWAFIDVFVTLVCGAAEMRDVGHGGRVSTAAVPHDVGQGSRRRRCENRRR